jgi:hypothetical protein
MLINHMRHFNLTSAVLVTLDFQSCSILPPLGERVRGAERVTIFKQLGNWHRVLTSDLTKRCRKGVKSPFPPA